MDTRPCEMDSTVLEVNLINLQRRWVHRFVEEELQEEVCSDREAEQVTSQRVTDEVRRLDRETVGNGLDAIPRCVINLTVRSFITHGWMHTVQHCRLTHRSIQKSNKR